MLEGFCKARLRQPQRTQDAILGATLCRKGMKVFPTPLVGQRGQSRIIDHSPLMLTLIGCLQGRFGPVPIRDEMCLGQGDWWNWPAGSPGWMMRRLAAKQPELRDSGGQ